MFRTGKKHLGLLYLLTLLIIGFLLMTGSSNSGIEFNESIFSFRRITLAPLVIVTTYIGFSWLILKKY